MSSPEEIVAEEPLTDPPGELTAKEEKEEGELILLRRIEIESLRYSFPASYTEGVYRFSIFLNESARVENVSTHREITGPTEMKMGESHEFLDNEEMFLQKLDFLNPINVAHTECLSSSLPMWKLTCRKSALCAIRNDVALSDRIFHPKSIRRKVLGRCRDLESDGAVV